MLDFLIRLDPGQTQPLYGQLAAQLRAAIVSGRLEAATKLPSTRALAETLDVSRNTVSEAYAQLLADGYLTARGGSGTYVSAELPAAARPRVGAGSKRAEHGVSLSAWARRLDPPSTPEGLRRKLPFDFRINAAAWEAFPYETWRRLAGRTWREATGEGMGYGDPAGWLPLRQAIAAYLGRARGVRCEPERVVIVNGSQQAVDILARLCLDPGDAAVVEEPGYPAARRTFAAYGARVIAAPVDGAGIVVDRLPSGGAERVKLVYVTPSHQFPTGATLAPGRRLALLDWAAARGALILEDDYDSEFRYEGRPIESLQGLDGHGCVVYLGTFSKVLFPSLRLGYVALPPALVAPFVAAKDLADRETGAPEQRVLAHFITDGHFERHLRRMRRLYSRRREALLHALRVHASGLIEPTAANTGMHLMARLNSPLAETETELAELAAGVGVGIYPAAPFWQAPPAGRPTFLLGFAGIDEAAIAEGVRRLAKVVSSQP